MMRKILDKSQYPYDAKTRRKDGFLLFPKVLNGELRWLEYAVWSEKFAWHGDSREDGGKWIAQYWL